MSGGMAFCYDPQDVLPQRINPEAVIFQRLEVTYWEEMLKGLVARHADETQSRFAAQLLNDWVTERRHFWQVVPREMLGRFEHPTGRQDLPAARA
jgi:glutamate synthase (NADPH/NADH) large chain